MADVFEVMAWKGAVLGAAAVAVVTYRRWSLAVLDRNRGTYCPPGVAQVPYYVGKSLRRLAIATKRRFLE